MKLYNYRAIIFYVIIISLLLSFKLEGSGDIIKKIQAIKNRIERVKYIYNNTGIQAIKNRKKIGGISTDELIGERKELGVALNSIITDIKGLQHQRELLSSSIGRYVKILSDQDKISFEGELDHILKLLQELESESADLASDFKKGDYETCQSSIRFRIDLIATINRELLVATEGLESILDGEVSSIDQKKKNNYQSDFENEIPDKSNPESLSSREFEILNTIEGGGSLKMNSLAFDYFVIDIKQADSKIDFFLKDDRQVYYQNFRNLVKDMRYKNRKLIFAMNAGMFSKNGQPQGLFIQDGEIIRDLDTNETDPGGNPYANFYLQPNGVLFVGRDGKPYIKSTSEFASWYPNSKALKSAVRFATQSGPMLIRNGEKNPNINRNGTSRHYRNGVGIIPNTNKLVFAISKEPVTFYEFYKFFDQLGCRNALYLDGAISAMYLPEIERYDGKRGPFGPMIGVYK